MAGSHIQARLKDYFERQIAWFEKTLEDLENLENLFEADEAHAIALLREGQVKDGKSLNDEFFSLLHEWESSEGSEGNKDGALAELAGCAERLSLDVQERIREGARISQARSADLTEAFGEIRRGRTMLARYRPLDPKEPRGLDRKG